ncbi:hypothetical protein ACFFMN_12750 [Planobispora siamensis]|uniref:Lipopolysaccharide biosynthesis protein n=1 Tax=Planobispora siamensis TaxID=936338 RepID=A0A8J3SAG5_9ACTN|nr:hypothetical protein [Planobispora siamensis]GIH89774.1 hypothetical protein Psi01_04040 [Planobispora siamensis]
MNEPPTAATRQLRWWPLAAAVFLGTLGGLSFSLVKGPVYTADAYVVVVPGTPGGTVQAVNFAQVYSRIATQPAILSLALAGGSPADGERLRRAVRASASTDAPMVGLSASAPGPQESADRANVVATALIAYANHRATATGVRLVSFAPALAPASPSSPPPPLSAAVGAAAGVLVGGLACLVPPIPLPARQRRRIEPWPAASRQGAL